MRGAGSYLVVLALAVVAGVLLAVGVHPALGLVPLVIPGAPAALLGWAQYRHGDPYDVTHEYR